ncbi:MAG: GTPase [Thermoplasmata archaeon]
MFLIPTVPTSQELLDKAFRRASRATVADPERRYRLRKLSIARLESASQTIAAALGKVVRSFPSFNELHPFHRELAGLVIDLDALKKALGALEWARVKVLEIARLELGRMRVSIDPEYLERRRAAAYGRISSVVSRVSGALETAARAREKLLSLPTIFPEAPTVVLAGCPNAGKSSLVARLSSARPRIAPYPFTTKGILVGHFTHKYRTYQVIDTPGLLDRPLKKRNKMELQAILALRHLADVLVFVIDPTEQCGTPLPRQRALLEEIRREFPGIEVIEAETRSDILKTGSCLAVSGLTGEGVEALRSLIVERMAAVEREKESSEKSEISELSEKSLYNGPYRSFRASEEE